MGKEQPKQAEGTSNRRWFSSQVRALLLTILASVVLLVAALPWYLSTPGMMSRIVARAVPDLLAEVTFDHVRIGWLGPIRLDGIRVVPQDGTDPPLEIRRIEVSHGFASILFTGGDLGRVLVDGIEADVVFDAAWVL